MSLAEGGSDLGDERWMAVLRALIPVGFGVMTWLVVLIVVGALASLHSVSVMALILLVGLGLLALPIYRFRPWSPGLTDRVVSFARTRRLTLAIAVGLLVFVRLPFVADLFGPLVGYLLLPLRATPQVLFGVRIFYAAQVGEFAGRLLFRAGSLYAEFLWFYALGTVLEALVRWGA